MFPLTLPILSQRNFLYYLGGHNSSRTRELYLFGTFLFLKRSFFISLLSLEHIMMDILIHKQGSLGCLCQPNLSSIIQLVEHYQLKSKGPIFIHILGALLLNWKIEIRAFQHLLKLHENDIVLHKTNNFRKINMTSDKYNLVKYFNSICQKMT